MSNAEESLGVRSPEIHSGSEQDAEASDDINPEEIQHTGSTKSARHGTIPHPFPFPDAYPPRLLECVRTGNIIGTDRLAFIRYMCDFIAGYNTCPSPSDYNRVAQAITDKFPCLADRLRGQPVWVIAS